MLSTSPPYMPLSPHSSTHPLVPPHTRPPHHPPTHAGEVAEDLTPAPSFALSPHPTTHPPHAGEVAEDLARYLADSEQAQAALGLGVAIARDQR